VPGPTEEPTTRIITLPALKSTLGFIILDLVGVGIIGDAMAKRIGFDTSFLMPVSAVICIAAGYAATRRGMWGATAGSVVTSVEMIAYLVTGDRMSDIVPRDQETSVAVITVFAVSLAGAALGAMGGWIARRRFRAAAAAGT
jgi:hypothetical protein